MFIIPKPQEMVTFEGNFELKGCLKTSKDNFEKVEKDAKQKFWCFFEIDGWVQ